MNATTRRRFLRCTALAPLAVVAGCSMTGTTTTVPTPTTLASDATLLANAMAAMEADPTIAASPLFAQVQKAAATVAADAPQWAQVLGGNGAVYNDVHSSRSFGVSYTNTQGKPILVSVWGTTTGADQLEAVTPASTVVALGPYYGSSGITISVQFIVPAGATYKVVTALSATNLVGWQEFY